MTNLITNEDGIERLFNDEELSVILKQLGYCSADYAKMCADELRNDIETIQAHGFECGVHGFIYYEELSDFYDENRESIARYFSDNEEDFQQIVEIRNIDPYDVITQTPQFKQQCVWAYVSMKLDSVDSDEIQVNTDDFE